MAYYGIKRKDLPTWHNDYQESSEEYVDPFAYDINKICPNSEFKVEGQAVYLDNLGGCSKVLSEFSGRGLSRKCPISKGCGSLLEGLPQERKYISFDCITDRMNYTQKSRQLVLTRANNNITVKEGENILATLSNTGPLLYFELLGGGGSGGADIDTPYFASGHGRGGGGGGAGAAISGILDFTQGSAFIVDIGKGGSSKENSNSSRVAGEDGADSKIYRADSPDAIHLIAKGGKGGYSVAGYSSAGTAPNSTSPYGKHAAGGIVLSYNPLTGSSSDRTNSSYIWVDSEIFMLHGYDGCSGGGNGHLDANNKTAIPGDKGGGSFYDDVRFSDMQLTDDEGNHLLYYKFGEHDDPKYHGGAYRGDLTTQGYTTTPAGGGGGASVRGDGGKGAHQSNRDNRNYSAEHGTNGSGGGGSCHYPADGSIVLILPTSGAGGSGVLTLGWVELKD